MFFNLIKQELPELKDQFAYTKQRSKTNALRLSTDIAHNLDLKDTIAVQALLLVFSKAFDRMLPDYALKKLSHLSITPALIPKLHNKGAPWSVFINDLKPGINCIK